MPTNYITTVQYKTIAPSKRLVAKANNIPFGVLKEPKAQFKKEEFLMSR